MFRAIMAVDDKGGISKGGTMPWPKNSLDLKWFKKNTSNSVVIMGRLTWEDPFMPTPLSNRVNVLVTNKKKIHFPEADEYISGNIEAGVIKLTKKYKNKDFYIIGGSEVLNQLFQLVEEFYLTRIYGDFNCDKKINLIRIKESMKMIDKIESDETCHFEIWKK